MEGEEDSFKGGLGDDDYEERDFGFRKEDLDKFGEKEKGVEEEILFFILKDIFW